MKGEQLYDKYMVYEFIGLAVVLFIFIHYNGMLRGFLIFICMFSGTGVAECTKRLFSGRYTSFTLWAAGSMSFTLIASLALLIYLRRKDSDSK